MTHQARWYLDTLPLAGARVVDVGANVGALSASFFDAVGPAGGLLSVEPLLPNVAALRALSAASGDPSRWQVEACAVCAHDGEVTLRLGGDAETPHNGVVVPAGPDRDGGYCVVPCRLLDRVTMPSPRIHAGHLAVNTRGDLAVVSAPRDGAKTLKPTGFSLSPSFISGSHLGLTTLGPT